MKRRLHLESWKVASLKLPPGGTPMVFFLSPFADLPVSWGSMVGRAGHLKQEHAVKPVCFLPAVAQLGNAGLEDLGGSPLQAPRGCSAHSAW